MASASDNLVQPPAKLPGAAAAPTRQVRTRDQQKQQNRKRNKPKPSQHAEDEALNEEEHQNKPDDEHQINYLA